MTIAGDTQGLPQAPRPLGPATELHPVKQRVFDSMLREQTPESAVGSRAL